ncbi:TetR/AcrR family transcriptional regulator [Thalassococcus sp. S3]|uniref:TetR/AcrR family transcriptional regulator n=1 Tax=Thalassococcus sp. S3 TaxID=2017482 RepID=UPI001024191B|nr:TetR/AcrR family transcriptional regulator [Thalassococcus sp. S3]QBF33495.1 TetR family transcriptional regulator [Thalassococcus sp. S3]
MIEAEKNDPSLSTKDRLIRTAARMFHSHGYHGVGLTELLSAAGAPKGSLYHHFPNGKSDLALAAATWASDGMLRLIAASFEPAESFQAGFTTLCHKLAKLLDLSNQSDGCPVTGILFDGPDNAAFRAHAAHLFDGWIREGAHHAERFGIPKESARRQGEHMFMLLEGGWLLARARRDSDVLRSLPEHLGSD